jgi:hypothetical protein
MPTRGRSNLKGTAKGRLEKPRNIPDGALCVHKKFHATLIGAAPGADERPPWGGADDPATAPPGRRVPRGTMRRCGVRVRQGRLITGEMLSYIVDIP